MNKKIIIIIIGVLVFIALVLGVIILITPDPVEPVEVISYDNNNLIETFDITRPNKRVERLIAIKTYEGEPNFQDMLKLTQDANLEYVELDEKAKDYMLIIPFNINGRMRIFNVEYNDYDEEYQLQKTPAYRCYNDERLPQNYGLLVRYSRPSTPKFAVKLYLREDEETNTYQTATYMITNTENGEPVKTIQLIKDDIEPGTQSYGSELEIKEEENPSDLEEETNSLEENNDEND